METKIVIDVDNSVPPSIDSIEPGDAFIDNDGDLILAYMQNDDDESTGFLVLHPGVAPFQVSLDGMEDIGVRRMVRTLSVRSEEQ